jgi:hypothetical protein
MQDPRLNMKGMSRSMLKLRERPLRKSEATRLFGWAQGRGDLERPSTQPSRHASDPAGGVKLTTGTEAVRCLHFSSRVFRWWLRGLGRLDEHTSAVLRAACICAE